MSAEQNDQLVLICGASASGKSASLRNIRNQEPRCIQETDLNDLFAAERVDCSGILCDRYASFVFDLSGGWFCELLPGICIQKIAAGTVCTAGVAIWCSSSAAFHYDHGTAYS